MTRWSLLQILCFSLCCVPLIEKSKLTVAFISCKAATITVCERYWGRWGWHVVTDLHWKFCIFFCFGLRTPNNASMVLSTCHFSFLLFLRMLGILSLSFASHATLCSIQIILRFLLSNHKESTEFTVMRCDAKMNSQRTIIIEQCARHHDQCNSLSFSVRRIKRSPHPLCCGCEIWIWISRIRDYTQKKCLTINSEWSMPSSDVLVRSRNIYDLPW